MAVPLLLPLLLAVDLPVVEASEGPPDLEAPDEAAALLSEPVVEASLFVVEGSLFEEFAVDFADDSFVDCALEASEVLEATVVDSAAVGELGKVTRGFKK